jgi:hypothetical protein
MLVLLPKLAQYHFLICELCNNLLHLSGSSCSILCASIC